jgi:uncharacterized protein DUF6230
MTDSEGLVQGRTRWRRFAALMGAMVVTTGLILFGMANGAIAASFTVSGQSFKVSADHLHGDGFKQFSGADVSKAGPIPVATSVINSATLTNLCQSVNVPNPFGTKIVLRIEAGKTTPASATGLVIGLQSLSGDATFHNIQIGRDGGDLSGSSALNGTFGQSADSIDVDNLQQVATSTSAGTFTLTGLNLQVLVGASANECF